MIVRKWMIVTHSALKSRRILVSAVCATMSVLWLAASAAADPAEVFAKPAPNVPALIKGGAEPVDVAHQLIKAGLERWAKVRDMEVVFTRNERLDGKTQCRGYETIHLRERNRPRSVYMKWVEGPGKGRELAYIKDRDRNHFTVTPGGLLGWAVVRRELNHPDVLAVSRHSVADAGMGPLLKKLDAQFTASRKDAVVVYCGETTIDGRACYRFLRFLPEKDGPDGVRYYCWKLDLSIDKELCLPVNVKCYGWKRQLDWQKEPFEDYTFTRFAFDQKMSDKSFEVHATRERPANDQ